MPQFTSVFHTHTHMHTINLKNYKEKQGYARRTECCVFLQIGEKQTSKFYTCPPVTEVYEGSVLADGHTFLHVNRIGSLFTYLVAFFYLFSLDIPPGISVLHIRWYFEGAIKCLQDDSYNITQLKLLEGRFVLDVVRC